MKNRKLICIIETWKKNNVQDECATLFEELVVVQTKFN
jgi:hypothetical protein